MTKTIKQQLLSMGIMEHEIDTHESDLYVIKNEISEKWLYDYEFKNNVTTFTDSFNELWYDIPFGYANEYAYKKKPARNIKFNKLDQKPVLLNELAPEQFELVDTLIYKIFKTENVAYTSTSSYAAFWNNENPDNTKAKYITLDGLKLLAITLDENKNLIAVYEDKEENDFYYHLTFDL